MAFVFQAGVLLQHEPVDGDNDELQASIDKFEGQKNKLRVERRRSD